MNRILMAMLLLGAAAPAYACNSEMMEVIDWHAVEISSPFFPYRLTAEVRYEGPKPYRMIHAGVMIDDVLGQNLGQVNLARDAQVQPGDTLIADGQVTVRERLGTVNRADTVIRTCVWSIVYDDGTIEKFE